MPKKKSVNLPKLLKAVKSGMSSKEIMEKFDIKTSAQLKSLYLEAVIGAGMAPGITGRAAKSGEENSRLIQVNKRGSLIVPRDLVEDMGFQIEDQFVVRKTKSGVSLKKQ